MAFSFNPGQQAGAATPSGTPSQPVQVAGVQPSSADKGDKNDIPSVPDSPFLFMQHRDQPMAVNAYIQILLIVITLLSVIASVILFAYSQYLVSSIESKKAKLATKEETFKEYPLDEMKKESNRFALLSKILSDHVSARSPLKFLEDVVEKQVVFSDFTFSKSKLASGYTISFSVLTNNYKALIQQLGSLGLAQYSKIVPNPKPEGLSDGLSNIKIRVTAPVFVQGILPEDIAFIQSATSSQSVPPAQSSSTKP